MSIPGRLMLTAVLITSLLLSSVSVVAQGVSATGDWGSLQGIPSGAKLSVKLKDGRTVEGRLKGVNESSLSVTRKNTATELKREEIAAVYQFKSKSATKATLIGMGVGAGSGAAIGAAASSNDDTFDKIDHAATAALTVIGAVSGAVTGYFIGRGYKRVLIYEGK